MESSKRPAKRPLGLKKSLASAGASKKSKTENERENEITLEIDEKVAQNDFQELQMIYESALSSYNGEGNGNKKEESDTDLNQVEGDKERSSLMLFRGVVHECDKMIRIRQDKLKESVPQATEEELNMLLERIKDNKILPQEFYLIYANALFYLSLLEDLNGHKSIDESAAAFLDESIYRIQNALEMDSSNANAHFSYARSLIQKAVIGADKFTESVLELIEKEIEFVFKDLSANLNSACELIHLYSTLVDIQTTIQDKIDWIRKMAKYWERIVEVQETNSKLIIGLGSNWLTAADISIEYLEENPETKAVSIEMIQFFLEKAIQYFERVENNTAIDESYIQSQIMLGECHVHLGNLLDTDLIDQDETAISGNVNQHARENDCQESVSHYRAAVECFQNVQKLQIDALPDRFEEFLSDWLKDLEEE